MATSLRQLLVGLTAIVLLVACDKPLPQDRDLGIRLDDWRVAAATVCAPLTGPVRESSLVDHGAEWDCNVVPELGGCLARIFTESKTEKQPLNSVEYRTASGDDTAECPGDPIEVAARLFAPFVREGGAPAIRRKLAPLASWVEKRPALTASFLMRDVAISIHGEGDLLQMHIAPRTKLHKEAVNIEEYGVPPRHLGLTLDEWRTSLAMVCAILEKEPDEQLQKPGETRWRCPTIRSLCLKGPCTLWPGEIQARSRKRDQRLRRVRYTCGRGCDVNLIEVGARLFGPFVSGNAAEIRRRLAPIRKWYRNLPRERASFVIGDLTILAVSSIGEVYLEARPRRAGDRSERPAPYRDHPFPLE